jgi:hypothetical protein
MLSMVWRMILPKRNFVLMPHELKRGALLLPKSMSQALLHNRMPQSSLPHILGGQRNTCVCVVIIISAIHFHSQSFLENIHIIADFTK